MALAHEYVAIYPSGATDPIGDSPQGDAGASYSATYTSMSAMEAAENGDYDTDDGTVLHVEIIPSDGSWNAAPDTTAVTFDGWATDKAGDGSYVEIKSYGTARSSTGNWDTAAYILQVTDTSALTCMIDNDHDNTEFLDITFIGIQFEHVDGAENNGAYNVCIYSPAYHHIIEFKKCFFLQDDSNTDSNLINFNTSSTLDVLVQNCIVQHGKDGIYLYNLDASAVFKIYNCTVTGCADGLQLDEEVGCTVKNTVVFNGTNDLYFETNVTFDYNAFDDDDGTSNEVDLNENASNEWTNAFENYESDFRVLSGGLLDGASEITYTDDNNVPSDDIAGNSRNTGAGQQVCIGAFEYVAGGSTSVPIMMHHLTKNIGV